MHACVQVNVKLWETSSTGGVLLLEANSSRAAVEVGGGPWWDAWKSEAEMKEPLKSLIKLPVDVDAISANLPASLRPKGL
jgi:tocopherol cyclase